mmetsp:Transcript_4022/g.9100  ORF Transcript_4022/g.9100 Transcript_4022/m.9100 type:complete len:221 (-) Transcript_4022:1879-2541(-)
MAFRRRCPTRGPPRSNPPRPPLAEALQRSRKNQTHLHTLPISRPAPLCQRRQREAFWTRSRLSAALGAKAGREQHMSRPWPSRRRVHRKNRQTRPPRSSSALPRQNGAARRWRACPQSLLPRPRQQPPRLSPPPQTPMHSHSQSHQKARAPPQRQRQHHHPQKHQRRRQQTHPQLQPLYSQLHPRPHPLRLQPCRPPPRPRRQMLQTHLHLRGRNPPHPH